MYKQETQKTINTHQYYFISDINLLKHSSINMGFYHLKTHCQRELN